MIPLVLLMSATSSIAFTFIIVLRHSRSNIKSHEILHLKFRFDVPLRGLTEYIIACAAV